MAAHEPEFVMYADGGTIGGSPGRGIYWNVKSEQGLASGGTDESGRRRRSDEAEFLALLAALRLLTSFAHQGNVALIRMDCRPLVRHVTLFKKPRAARLRDLYWAVVETLARLNEREVRVQIQWVPREQIVAVLGH